MKSILLAVAFFGAGAALDIYAGTRLLAAVDSKSWPTADGTMGTSEIETTRARRNASYAAKVAFTYTVDGKVYAGNQVGFGNEGIGDRLEAQSVVDRFPRGAAIKVHYDPANPATACLIVGIESWRDFVPLAIGLALTGIGAYALGQIVGQQLRRKKAPPPRQRASKH